MAKKIIAIPGFMNDAGVHFGAGYNHLDFISNFGIPRILMPGEDYYPVDMLYLPGGRDLNPLSYGEAPGFKTSNTDVYKQYFYDKKLKEYVENNIPIFGICLGAQQLAAYFGSKIKQDLKFHKTSDDRWETAHKIYPTGQLAHGLLDVKSLEVNSHHHQGILRSQLSSELFPLFVAPNEENKEDWIVEVFKHKTRNIYAVQYHPEELYDELSINIINLLLSA